jgi:hypothetical protein
MTRYISSWRNEISSLCTCTKTSCHGAMKKHFLCMTPETSLGAMKHPREDTSPFGTSTEISSHHDCVTERNILSWYKSRNIFSWYQSRKHPLLMSHKETSSLGIKQGISSVGINQGNILSCCHTVPQKEISSVDVTQRNILS